MPHSSWSSPEPCTYAKPPARRPVPVSASVRRDADMQMTGMKVRSGFGGRRGKADVAGVIQSGRKGCGRSGRTYAESCQPRQSKANAGGRGGERGRTRRARAQPSMRAAICACSCALTVPGGVYSALSHLGGAADLEAARMAMARLRTAHQMGTVLESASGMRLPARVESTRTNLGSDQSVGR